MNRLVLLSKYFIKNSLESMFKGDKYNALKTTIFMLVFIILMSSPFALMVSALYEPLKGVGQEGILLSMIYLAGTAIMLFFGIFTILNIFYFSEDIQDFLPLPFKSGEIVIGKFIAAFTDMVIYSTLLIIPLITFGICSGSGILYYVYVVISILLVTVVPLILASIICLLIMRVVPLTKHKDAVKLVTGCLSLVLVVGLNVFLQGNANDESSHTDYMVQLMSKGDNSIMQSINGFFIVNKLCANSLLNSNNLQGLLNIILAILISILLVVIYYVLGNKLYLKSVIGMSETYSKRKNVLNEGSKGNLIANSPRKALVKKDLKIIFRTPQFFINCVAMLIYMPAIFIVLFVSNGSISKLSEFVSASSERYGFVIAIVFLATSLFICSAGTSYSSISREGKDFKVSKYIPIGYKIQVQSKLITSLLINSLGLIIIIGLLVWLKINILLFILSAIISASTIILVSLFGMYTDFKSPNLDWEDEKQMFKGNYVPAVIAILLMVIGGIYIVMSLFIKNYFLIFLIIFAVNIIASNIFYKKINKLAKNIYSN